MDLEMILPVVAGASGMFAGCAVLYSKLRPQFSVKVNCHFCNTDTKVSYCNKDGWVCTHCEQYNGFNEDGDYNRDIPAQYCEALNTPQGFRPSKKTESPTLAIGNGLCQTCNLNQTLKLRALSDYTPINEDDYDHEIEEYRKRLERTYALCRQCEASLHQTLGKQDSWLKPKLISWRLTTTALKKDLTKHIPPTIHKLSLPLRILHLFGLLIASTLFMANIHHLQQHSGTVIVSFGLELSSYLKEVWRCTSAFVISGLSLLLATIFSSGKETLLVSDAIGSFIWVGQLALTSSQHFIDQQEYNSIQVMVSFVLVMMSIWILLVPRRPASLMSPRSLNKKIRNLGDSNDSFGLEDSTNTQDASLTEELNNLINPGSDSPPLPENSHLNSTLKPNSTLHCNSSLFGANSTLMANKPTADVDLDSTLGDLKISTPKKNNSIMRPDTPFSSKGLFSDRNGSMSQLNESLYSYRDGNNGIPVGSPRHPKKVTQSSWVAGGYWGNSTNPLANGLQHHNLNKYGQPHGSNAQLFPLSRSSSQSSGFISLSNGGPDQLNHSHYHPQYQSDILGHTSAPNSRPGSICGGDYECNSVLSEPVYKSFAYQSTLLPSDSASNYGANLRQRHPDLDSRSVCSGTSFIPGSEATLRRPPSPTQSTSTFIHNPTLRRHSSSCSSSRSNSNEYDAKISNYNENLNKPNGINYRNPWIAFFLGMSIAGNIFLGFTLFSSRLNISEYFLSQFR